MTFDNELPEWKNSGAPPDDTLKEQGFFAGYKLGAGTLNWFFSLVGKAISEIQGKLGNHQHKISDVSELQDSLNSKSNSGHTHSEYATTAFVQNAINTVNSRIAAIGSVVDYADITIKVTKTALSGGQTNFKVTSATGAWAISATAVTTGFDTHSKDDEFDGAMGVNISVNTNKSVTITLDNTNMPTCDIDVSAGGSFTKRVYYHK